MPPSCCVKGSRVACEIADVRDVPAAYRGIKVGCYFRMKKDAKSSTDVFERRQP